MFEYDPKSQQAAYTLDKYDFSKEIAQAKENRLGYCGLVDLLSSVSEEVSNAIENMTEDEFDIYLRIRYNAHFGEIITTYIY